MLLFDSGSIYQVTCLRLYGDREANMSSVPGPDALLVLTPLLLASY